MYRIFACLLAAISLSAADVNTFSIVAYDPATGDCGVTVASKYFSVGAVVPWAEAGTGCIATHYHARWYFSPEVSEDLPIYSISVTRVPVHDYLQVVILAESEQYPK